MSDWLRELIHKVITPRFQDLTPNEMWHLPYASKIPKGIKYLEVGGYRGFGPQFVMAIGDSIDNKGNNWIVKYTPEYMSGQTAGFHREAVNPKTGETQSRFVKGEPSKDLQTSPPEDWGFWGDESYLDFFKKGGGIHIRPENRGKFNATKARTGKTTEELTHSKNPLTRKRAIFAQNARKWKHQNGGQLTTIPIINYLQVLLP